jgi:hypothetical protein
MHMNLPSHLTAARPPSTAAHLPPVKNSLSPAQAATVAAVSVAGRSPELRSVYITDCTADAYRRQLRRNWEDVGHRREMV